MNLSLTLTFALVGALTGKLAPSRAAYHFVDIGALSGGFSAAYGVNASGQVTGRSRLSNGHYRAFLYSNGVMTDLGVLDGRPDSYGYGIGDNGMVVGFCNSAQGVDLPLDQLDDVPFASLGGTTYLLPGGTYQWVRAAQVNQAGQIAGSAGSGTSVVATITRDATLTAIPTLGGDYGQGACINPSGTLVGASRRLDGNLHAYSYFGGRITDLGTLGGLSSRATWINASSFIVGAAQTAAGVEHAFLCLKGSMADLGTLGGASVAYCINSASTAVGASVDTHGYRRAVVWTARSIEDLNAVADASASGWFLEEARGISDSGVIVGTASKNGVEHAFMLIPNNKA